MQQPQQQITPEQAIQIAIQHHQASRFKEAEAIYRQVLAVQPERFDALHLLGVLAYQVGRSDAAVELIRRAITISSNVPEAHYNLGNALMAERKFQQARVAYMRSIELKPEYAEAHNNLGNCLNEQGKMDEAVAAYARAIQILPDFADALYNRANIFKNRGKLDEAAAGYVRAIELKPDHADAYSNLGEVLRASGKVAEAAAACAKAIELKPDFAEACNNFGNALRDQGNAAGAAAAYRKAVELKPAMAEAHYNLGNVLRDEGNLPDAIAAFAKAIELKADFPDAHYNLANCLSANGNLDAAVAAYGTAIRLAPAHAESHNNLGNTLKEQGLIDDALASYDRAIALKPDQAAFGSNRLYTIHFHPGYEAAKLREEHRKWNRRHAEPLARMARPHEMAPDGATAATGSTERRLRIGYVSPDFSFHSVGRFLLPLLQRRDRAGFEIFCYSDVRSPDPITEHFQSVVDHWRELAGQSDEQAAELIRNDKIDILVDLAMHTANNRLLVFARKPAPVQVTYLAYCSTTGLETIDYRFTDRHFDPPEIPDAHYSEKSIRLPETYWCYEPVTMMEVAPLPALAAGYITFGCLNNFAKASAPALKTWARVLRETPRSRLLLHAREGSHRQRVLDIFKSDSVDPERITFADRLSGEDYFKLYNSIDIALDPFPCAGGATTCDALWMGVPAVTLNGRTAVGRAGVSILTNVGLAGLIAKSANQYVRVAVELAKDLTRLGKVRSGLRQRMQKSPLMDATRLVGHIESAYRQMWRH